MVMEQLKATIPRIPPGEASSASSEEDIIAGAPRNEGIISLRNPDFSPGPSTAFRGPVFSPEPALDNSGVEHVGEIIQQQYFNQLMDEMRRWNPMCELDGDPVAPRGRILSEPGASSSSSEPPINVFLRNLGGSDSEFSTPSTPCKFTGLEPHPCQDSPFQMAQSLSVILKSPEIRKYQSKLRPCANPDCGACEAKRKRRSERWKRWKVLNQDQSPCQVD